MQETIIAILMITGSLLMMIAGLGIVRMPDLFMRMSATAKAATLGAGFILLAVALRFMHLGITTRALATIFFLVLTAPVSAHMIARAAYSVGVPLWEKTVVDQLCDQFDRCSDDFADDHTPTDDDSKPGS